MPHGPTRNSPVPLSPMHSTPPNTRRAIWLARFRVPKERRILRAKTPVSAASTGWRSVHSGTLQGATGGTQTHSRRTGVKLGRLRYARQGLVRVPESNTKYGGKLGKTGAPPSRCCGQVSVSPQGFPSEKNPLFVGLSALAPLFTGGRFIIGFALASDRLRSGQACCPVDGLLP
jgi:hypothetical protein